VSHTSRRLGDTAPRAVRKVDCPDLTRRGDSLRRGGAPMRSTLTVSAKGQVTLCKEMLPHLGVASGEMVVVDLLSDGRG
jgi:hypothetical protein